MFYLTSLTKELSIDPVDLKDRKDFLVNVVSKKVTELEGKVIGDNGYIVSIVEFSKKGNDGIIDNETGKVCIKVDYKAITFKLLQNEVLDVFVKHINEHGLFCYIGPLQIFVSKLMIAPNKWEYNAVSNAWENQGKIVKPNTMVRIKIIAIKTNSNEITALGSFEEFKKIQA